MRGKIRQSAVSYYQIKRGLIYKDTKNQLKIFDKMCKKFDIILMDDISVFEDGGKEEAGM